MKRVLSAILSLTMIFSLCACGPKAPAWQEQYDLGVKYLTDGSYEEAIIAFTAAIEIDPKQAAAYVGRGDAYIASGETEENLAAAQVDYKKAIELDETNTKAYLGLANVYICRGDLEKAQEILEKALEQNSGNSELEDLLETVRSLASVDYEIVTQDQSYYNDAGEALIELYYDLVVLKGDRPEVEQINQALEQAYTQYLPPEERESMGEYLSPNQPWGPDPQQPFFYNVGAEVTHNADGILSVALSQDWFMGGVRNLDYSGQTYDLRSGQPMGLAELLPWEDEVILAYLRAAVKDYMRENPDRLWDEDAHKTVDNYTLEDFSFYIQDGEVVLCIPTYALGPGASGASLIPSGLYLSNETPVDGQELLQRAAGEDGVSVWDWLDDSQSEVRGYNVAVSEFVFQQDGACHLRFGYYQSEWMGSYEGSYQLADDVLSCEMRDEQGGTWNYQFRLVPMGEKLALVQQSEKGPFVWHQEGSILILTPIN